MYIYYRTYNRTYLGKSADGKDVTGVTPIRLCFACAVKEIIKHGNDDVHSFITNKEYLVKCERCGGD